MKFSEIKGFAKSASTAAKLLAPITTMMNNPKVRTYRASENGNVMGYLLSMLENEPDATAEVFAIINGRDVKEFRENCTAADITNSISEIIANDDLAVLFGLRGKKTEKTSTSSRSANTGAKKK